METFELEAFEVSKQMPSKLDIDLHAIFTMCECLKSVKTFVFVHCIMLCI